MTVQQLVTGISDTYAEELQNLLDASPDVICSFDTEGKFITVSAACEKIWGYTKDELIGTSYLDYTCPEDYTKTGIVARFVFDGGNDLSDFENRWVRKDGSLVPMAWSAKWYKNKTTLCCVGKDDTARRKKEEEVRISKERFKFVSMATSDVIWDRNFETGELFHNASATALYGALPDSSEALEDFWKAHLHPEDKERVVQSQKAAIKNPKCWHWKEKYRFIKNSGDINYLSDRAVIIRNQKGRAIRMVGAVRDITEAKKFEEAERLAEQRYRLLFEQSPFPRWIFDEKTYRILEVNDAATSHYGYTRAEFLQMTIFDLRPEIERAKTVNRAKQLQGKEGKRFNGLVKHKKKTGEVIDVEITSHGLIYNDHLQIVVIANDVTDKMQAEQEIAKAIITTQEKERSIIGKELHDNVNQLLTTAKLYIQNINYFPEQREVFSEKGAEIVQKCITEIRSLSRALITPTLTDLGFKITIDEMVAYYRELQLFCIELDYSIDENTVGADLKLSIYRILQELFNNTVKYAHATQVDVTIQERNGYLRIVYKDNGFGFDSTCIAKGMGITNMKSRVAIHKGKMRIISSKGQGSKAFVIFPCE